MNRQDVAYICKEHYSAIKRMKNAVAHRLAANTVPGAVARAQEDRVPLIQNAYKRQLG